MLALNQSNMQIYLRSVEAAAKHHAPHVANVIPAIIGNVLLRAKEGSILIREAHTRANRMGLAMQFETKKGRYALAYQHHISRKISLRMDSFRGFELEWFDNDSKLETVNRIFGGL